jgi:hypothetical protein
MKTATGRHASSVHKLVELHWHQTARINYFQESAMRFMRHLRVLADARQKPQVFRTNRDSPALQSATNISLQKRLNLATPRRQRRIRTSAKGRW